MPILILVVGPISATSIGIRRKRSIDSAPNILFNLRIIEKYPHIKSMMLFISFPMRYRTPIAVDGSGGRGRGERKSWSRWCLALDILTTHNFELGVSTPNSLPGRRVGNPNPEVFVTWHSKLRNLASNFLPGTTPLQQ
jgi:hypothetical protein